MVDGMTSRPGPRSETLILRRNDIAALLGMQDCIDAVERAFLDHAAGTAIPPAVIGTHVDGGSFHVKTAGMHDAVDGRPFFAAKVNANFPGNPDRNGLPTIQGVLVLFDAADGRVLALLDSLEITTLRTAAATAVAARFLAPDVARVTICGCGEQARSQLRALACVRPLERVVAIDPSSMRARQLADDMSAELGLEIVVAREPADAARVTNVWITCTPAHRWFLGREHVAPGSFVAAVGADNPHKQEIEPELLAMNVVVADILDQCATIGDLHHALDAGAMHREDVRAELAEVVAGTKTGRRSADEIIVFDSTGTALEDVAAATVAYRRALAAGVGTTVDLGMLAGKVPRAGDN
jgi:alanine dehydrogenase